jgi:nucleotide-binding universal stress UspA family protein
MIKRILLGVAGTPATAAKAHYAVEPAKRFGASVSPVSVVDSTRLARIGPAPAGALHLAAQMVDSRVRLSREQSEAALAGFEERCQAGGVACEMIRREGDPFDVLA